MRVRRTDLRIWLIGVVLVHTLIQISGENSGDTTTVETAPDGETEVEETKEESVHETSSLAVVEEAGEEESENDEVTKEISPTEKLETTTTTVTEEAVTHTSSSEKPVSIPEAEVTKEGAPASTFAIWNSNKKICLLAKFKADFTIRFQSKKEEQTVVESLPENAEQRGECGGNNKNRTLRLSWGSFDFIMTFSKISKSDDSEEKWAAKVLELLYDTSKRPFVSAINGGKMTARSEDLQVFKTPVGKSYSCPSEEIKLYSSKNEVATVSFKDIRLQPFQVKQGKFSPSHQCDQGIITVTEEPFVQDETVPLAVGLTLAILTLLVVLGFSVYRAYTVRKVDYNSME